jgi:hypothetical protein
MAYTYSKIATHTVSGTSSPRVSFISIPQTYTDLKVVYSVRRSNSGLSGAGVIYLNSGTEVTGDTSYSNRGLQGNGTSAGVNNSSLNTTFLYMGNMNGNSATANTFSNGELYIPNYAGSRFKSTSVDAVGENNGSEAYINLQAAVKVNSAPITSITFEVGNTADYWMPNSSFHLYGIKAEI